MTQTYSRLRLILGDQLNASHSWFTEQSSDTLYLIAELAQETNYVLHHVQKICAFFAAMEQFAKALQTADFQVLHLNLDDTQAFNDLPQLLRHLIEKHQIRQFEYQLPDEYRLRKQLADVSAQLAIPAQAVGTFI
ncbi:cryptochrome/photolyase family protein [Oceanisphaera sp. W20_SRM_FM3]|uniref:cryptochrome/photolyase family protein n=1 Tax=Oceanisphaera sp. W20_SRM_FM3 TaxID=3240267 RepID=UPI003F9A8603